jgi:hypothetical protein
MGAFGLDFLSRPGGKGEGLSQASPELVPEKMSRRKNHHPPAAGLPHGLDHPDKLVLGKKARRRVGQKTGDLGPPDLPGYLLFLEGFESGAQTIKKTIELPLYYTGLTDVALIREREGPQVSYDIDRGYNARLPVKIPPRSLTWLIIE